MSNGLLQTHDGDHPDESWVDDGRLVLEVEDLEMHFPVVSKIRRKVTGWVHAVNGVDLTVSRGETVGLVGESGCGKSTLARTIIGLHTPSGGRALVNGIDIANCSRHERRALRREVQMVMQDPYGSLNPRMKVRDIVAEPLTAQSRFGRTEIRRKVTEVLEMVGLDANHAVRFPHEFSGGQRQRIGIARALVLDPSLLILDEPVSALDVSIQAQILNLLHDLQRELDIGLLMIAHDLSVVRHIADRVGVMYLGKIVEMGSNSELYETPAHPYTKTLLSAVPVPIPGRQPGITDIVLEGELPSPTDPPSGCAFRTRCWKADELCTTDVPSLVVRDSVDHVCACHHPALHESVPTI